MPQVIGVPKRRRRAKNALPPCPKPLKNSSNSDSRSDRIRRRDAANCSDETYRAAGAQIVDGAAKLWAESDIVFKVSVPTAEEVALMHEGQTLITFIWPAQNPELMQQLAARKVTVLAIDALPRMLSRAQKMDALTSQAGVAGYRAVIEAANAFGASSTARLPPRARCRPPRCSSPVPVWPAWPRSAPPPAWAPSCAPTTPAPKWPTRWCRWW